MILLTNHSKDLVNGYMGVVNEFNRQRFPVVQFDDSINLTVEPKTLTVADK